MAFKVIQSKKKMIKMEKSKKMETNAGQVVKWGQTGTAGAVFRSNGTNWGNTCGEKDGGAKRCAGIKGVSARESRGLDLGSEKDRVSNESLG
jgi:hypothetical protein